MSACWPPTVGARAQRVDLPSYSHLGCRSEQNRTLAPLTPSCSRDLLQQPGCACIQPRSGRRLVRDLRFRGEIEHAGCLSLVGHPRIMRVGRPIKVPAAAVRARHGEFFQPVRRTGERNLPRASCAADARVAPGIVPDRCHDRVLSHLAHTRRWTGSRLASIGRGMWTLRPRSSLHPSAQDKA